MEILIFRTNVNCQKSVDDLAHSLNGFPEVWKWSFDLEDCDKIFRVEAASNISGKLINLMQRKGFDCEELFYEL